jgi:hypothetical protein
MPVHQSYPYDGRLFPRQPSMLRRVGEALVSWADRREAASAERAVRRHGSTDYLPDHLREDVGMPPLRQWPQLYNRW